jgi:hypothetical protein
MSVPLRKDQPEQYQPEQELTTADLARSKPPVSEGLRREPGLSNGPLTEGGEAVAPTADNSRVDNAADTTPLFLNDELGDMRSRWDAVQAAFVDEPRRAVEQADGLVAFAMKRLAEVFSDERSKLEKQWDRGDNVSTEDLRIALQRYRSFFHRLLSL